MDGALAIADPMPEDQPAPELHATREPPGSAEPVTPRQIIEALLFASDAPLPAAKIAQVLGVGDARDVRRHIADLNAAYEQTGSSFRIEEIANGFQMLTRPVFNAWLAKLLRARQDTRLTPAALETLAVIAYKQPVARADIEAVRGVACGDVINRLRELGLVTIAGRAEDLGRPLLYGTTKRFLEVFGLASIAELPKVESLRDGMKGAGDAAVVPVTTPPSAADEPSPESVVIDTTPDADVPRDSDTPPAARDGEDEPRPA